MPLKMYLGNIEIGGGTRVTESPTEPTSPSQGDIWIKTVPLFGATARYLAAGNVSQTPQILESADAQTWSLVQSMTAYPTNFGYARTPLIVPRGINAVVALDLVTGQTRYVDGDDHSAFTAGPALGAPATSTYADLARGPSSHLVVADRVYVVHDDGTIITGAAWAGGSRTCAWSDALGVYVARSNGGALYSVTERGAVTQIGTFAGTGNTQGGIAYSPTLGRYVVSNRPTLYYSDDLSSWTQCTLNGGLTNYVPCMKWLPINGVFIAAGGAGIGRSSDGKTFDTVGTLTSEVNTIFEDDNGDIYIGATTTGMRRSTDGGSTWASVSSGGYGQISYITKVPSDATQRTVYRYDGSAWTSLN